MEHWSLEKMIAFGMLLSEPIEKNSWSGLVNNTRVEGRIVRILPDKRYGFVRVGKLDYFFHKDDYMGNWDDLIDSDRKLQVSCVIVESPKGTRVGDVRPLIDESFIE